MTLPERTRLGPYELIAALGAGGMGEVYSARDTKLDRMVAVKVLPAHLTENADARARFEREAKAVAALTHPNILAIHDFGTFEGTAYAAMELLEGETLGQRLARGALPVRRAIEFAVQIAHGLAAAHEKGIVHRDLKPDNLFVTEDGRVKVLDFGLARHTGVAEAGSRDDSPTVTRHTDAGTVLGTVGYMSPEQVRGRRADHRSDVFSLGCVVYEMLAGQKAFHRETTAETMTAILREEASELTAVSRSVSPALARVVNRCLEKEPGERFQSARDVAFALEAVSGPSRAPSVPTRAPHGARGRVGRAAIVGVLLAVAFAAGRWVMPSASQVSPTFTRLTFRRGHVTSARFTPDGNTIVYGATWEGEPIRVFSTRPGSFESTLLDLPAGDVLSVSRSGELALSLGRRFQHWFLTTGRLARVSLSGGAPRELLDGVMEASWTPDGKGLLVVRDVEGKCRLELGPGNVLYETVGWISDAKLSPAGDIVAFLEHPMRGADNGRVAMMPAGGRGPAKTLSPEFASVQGLAWHPRLGEIWYTGAQSGWNSTLFAARPEGPSRVVLRIPGRLRLHDIDADGRVLLANEHLRVGSLVGSMDGAPEREVSWLEATYGMGLSTDGTRVVLNEQGEGAGQRYGVYLRGLDGSPAVRLGDGLLGALSPRGGWVATITQDEAPHISILPTGPGEPRALAGGGLNYQSVAWLPGEEGVAFAAAEGSGGIRLYKQDLSGAPQPFTAEGVGVLLYLAVTPDGRGVATLRADGSVALFPLAGGEPTPVPAAQAGDAPMRFSADGRALFCARAGMASAEIVRIDLDSRKRSVWKELRPADPAGVVTVAPTDVTPDGRRYLYTFVREISDLFLVEGLP